MDYLTLFFVSVSFLVTMLLMPFWIRKAKDLGLVWEDMNKFDQRKVSGSGGIIAVLGFVIGVLAYIAYRTFFIHTNLFLSEILAMLSVVLFLGSLGFIDDLFGWKKGGLSRRTRLILVAFAAIPLVVINAGRSDIGLPIIGLIDLGIIYPLIAIPIGIVGASTTYNILAGFNGLEAGQGILLLSAMGIVSYFTGSPWLSVISFVMVGALIALLLFNFCPARVFIGDSITLVVGGLIAIIAILGNFEKVAVFFFIPYIIEAGLKLRGRLIKQSFGRPREDGSLGLRYNKIYSLNHLAIFLMQKLGFRVTERKAIFLIWTFQILIIVLGFIIYKEGIF